MHTCTWQIHVHGTTHIPLIVHSLLYMCIGLHSSSVWSLFFNLSISFWFLTWACCCCYRNTNKKRYTPLSLLITTFSIIPSHYHPSLHSPLSLLNTIPPYILHYPFSLPPLPRLSLLITIPPYPPIHIHSPLSLIFDYYPLSLFRIVH